MECGRLLPLNYKERGICLALAFLLIVFLFVVVLIALFAFPPTSLVKALEGNSKKKDEPKKDEPAHPPKDGSA